MQHFKARKFKCQICKNEFGRNSTLLAHLRTHKKTKESKEDFDNTTTRPESKATLVNNTAIAEEEKNFWCEDNQELFSFEENNNHVFDLNFDQGQNYITSSNNNSDNEYQSDGLIFF